MQFADPNMADSPCQGPIPRMLPFRQMKHLLASQYTAAESRFHPGAGRPTWNHLSQGPDIMYHEAFAMGFLEGRCTDKFELDFKHIPDVDARHLERSCYFVNGPANETACVHSLRCSRPVSHVWSIQRTLHLTPDMPDQRSLQKAMELRPAGPHSTLGLLQIPRLMHVLTELQDSAFVSKNNACQPKEALKF